ncbi:hypothetical protein K1T71_003815 [Dendrolimus kikuchii]|uniref:Uncharacterized protein n=1 Tax=Dendrolimus kikuchii TaxID=765133 RepID=A0ACC1D9A1_9NEOP|nr:hypothetical protein K1T71_003815 [Dendrolimus kikuchii]
MLPPDLKEIVSNCAVFVTILQLLSGVLVCKQYVANRTTAEASVLPFLCGLLSAGYWALYGLSKKDNIIIFINLIGINLMVIYIIVFYMYTFKKSTVLKQIITVAVFFILSYGYISSEEDSHRHDILGFIACSLTLVAIAAPMSKLFYVLKVKNTECLPFPMILMSFFVCLLWYIYGLIENDIFIIVPNLIGGTLGVGQLSLFWIYPRKPQSPILTKSLVA